MLLNLLMAGLGVLGAQDEVGSKSCAGCHAAIYRKYMASGMARTSGRTGSGGFRESFETAEFEGNSAQFRISADYGFSFRKGDVEATRKADWFVGSGAQGRSYLFSVGGFLYQAPVSYYSLSRRWGVSPGYERNRTVDLTRPVEPACLQCHASRPRPVAGTQNRFGSPPFLEDGIGCERCHGPGRDHIMRMTANRKASQRGIVNPAKLDAGRRDSVCAQCHLTGAARIARARRTPYRPGDRLQDSLAVFVWSGAGSEVTATSHFEKLAQSSCKKISGDKLWCGTCHHPHGGPRDTNVACSHCHDTRPTVCTQKCVDCHMPKSQTRTGEHIAFTNHSIPRRPDVAPSSRGNVRELASFWKIEPDSRDLAMGYAVVAPGEPAVRQLALDLLQSAVQRAPDDWPVVSQLAQFYDRMRREDQAMELCERIVVGDPSNTAAAANLAIYYVKRGRTAEAIRLWDGVLKLNPAQTGVRMNLAVALYQSGDRPAAVAALRTALEYDPGHDGARRMLSEMN